LHLNLGYFVVFFFCFLFFFPLWWDNIRTTYETSSPGLEAEGLTPKLLRLKLYCIWTWGFFFYPFSVSLMPFKLTVDYYTISPCLFLWHCFFLFLFVCFVLFLLVWLFSPFTLPSLLSLSSQPSILDITIVIIAS
jgi:hypothetical protein